MVDIEQIVKNRVLYTIPGMDRVRISRDHIYKSVGADDLCFDVYSPPEAADLLPAVIFVHGDGAPERLETARGWGQYVSWGQLVAASGLIGVVANHRSSAGHTRMTDPMSDVEDLMRAVRDTAETHGINRDRLAIWTCSAGGPFGLRAAFYGAPRHIRAVVAYYALMDLLHLRGASPPVVDDQTIRDFSAIYYLQEAASERREAPILIAKAGQDSPHFNASIDRFAAKAADTRLRVEMLTHPDGQHGFDIFDDDDQTRSIVKQTLSFLKLNLLL
jgi:acetyl esterase/lipase